MAALHDGETLLEGAPGDVLTHPSLPAKNFGLSRYTQAARSAAENGWWRSGRRLPVTLEEAVEGFLQLRG